MRYKNRKAVDMNGYLVEILSNNELDAETLDRANELVKRFVNPS